MHAWRKIFFPFSLLYGLVVSIRNFLYDTKILKTLSHDVPVICVGNLSFGGTGKTPVTEYLIRLLKDKYRVAVLSRGYKKRSKGFYLAGEEASVEKLGDEPYQYYRKFPGIYVAVDANRNRGVRNLMQLPEPPEVILLDDAFQHRKIKAGLSILLTTYANLYVDDLLFPAGNLRDARREARRANLVIVTKCPGNLTEEARLKIAAKVKLRLHQRLFFASIQYETFLLSSGEKLRLEAMRTIFFTLVTGIADPMPLVRFLKEKELRFEHLKYPDHHAFSSKEVSMLKQKECVVTTEKDYVRLQHQLSNLYYLPIKTVFMGEKAAFDKEIKNYLEAK